MTKPDYFGCVWKDKSKDVLSQIPDHEQNSHQTLAPIFYPLNFLTEMEILENAMRKNPP